MAAIFLFISLIFIFGLVLAPVGIFLVSIGVWRRHHGETEPPLPPSAATTFARAGGHLTH